MADTRHLLRQGIAAVKAGRKEEARQALMQVIELDERNELAWMWLSGVVDDPADQRICLENVLEINPDNASAQKGLVWLNKQYPPAELARAVHSEPAPQPPVAAPQSTVASVPEDTREDIPAEVERDTLVEAEPAPSEAGSGRFLSYDGKTPLHLRPKESLSLPPEPAPAIPEAQHCPYCGTPTSLTQRRCIQCRNDLMIRGALREQRSVALVVLVILWGLGSVLTIGSGAINVVALFVTPEPVSIDTMLATILWALFGSLLGISITRGLWQRKRWAYVVNAVLLGLNIVVLAILALTLMFSGPTGVLTWILPPEAPSVSEIAGVVATILGVILACGFVVAALYVVLAVLSYRDFYGTKQRFLVEVPKRDDVEHYNAGVAYKNRGMWYMAAKEWERAVAKRSGDANYRHALGLAYAQLNQFDRARAVLQEALALAPNDPRIQESIALIEKRAHKRKE